MKFTDKLKDVMGRDTKKKFEEADEEYYNPTGSEGFADEVRQNPQYSKVIEKLRVLREEQDRLILRLRQIELDIDTCLVLISIQREREHLRGEDNGKL